MISSAAKAGSNDTSLARRPASSAPEEIAVYLVESSKGLVSIQSLPIKADRTLIVVLGQFRFTEGFLDGQADIWYCNDFCKAALNGIAQNIQEFCRDGTMRLVFTDDTFNESSFVIQQALAPANPRLILIDHYRHSGLSYKDQYGIRALVRFRHPLARHFRRFCPIKFSNGAIGYRLKLRFDHIEYFKEQADGLNKKSIAAKVVILIPLHQSPYYSSYLELIDDILRRRARSMGDGLQEPPSLAYKMHPRCTEHDRQAMASHPSIAGMAQLPACTPLEFYDLRGKTVVNLDSSIGNPSQARVLLMARHFGHTAEESSNMTGEHCNDLELEQALCLSADHAPPDQARNEHASPCMKPR